MSKRKREKELRDTDKSVIVAKGRGVGRGGGDIRGISGDRKKIK